MKVPRFSVLKRKADHGVGCQAFHFHAALQVEDDGLAGLELVREDGDAGDAEELYGRLHSVPGASLSGVRYQMLSGPAGTFRLVQIGVNTPYTAFPGIPFGGYKHSGIGRELGM